MTTTHYIDGFQYTEDKLDFFPHAEGYVKVTHASSGGIGGGATNYNYVFNYTDYLGNIRLRYAINPVNQWLEILEEDHYYPFGLKHQGYNGEHEIFDIGTPGTVVIVPITPLMSDPYKYKFNGMELQTEFNIELYDYGMRNYDPALGRWMNIDPLAEIARRWSPYTYAYNNPIYFIDPDGMTSIPMAATWQPADLFTVTTLDKNGETLDTKTVNTLQGTGYELGWNEGADGRDLGGGNAPSPETHPGQVGDSGGGNPPCRYCALFNLMAKSLEWFNKSVESSKGGGYLGVSYDFALAGGFTFNSVWDDEGGLALYYGAGGTIGLAASIGIEGGDISPTTLNGFTVDNFSGTSAQWDFSAGPIGYSTGGTIDAGQLRPVERMNWNNFGNTPRGYETNSGSLSRGGWFKSRIGAGAMWSQNHTKILRLR